MLDAFFMVKNPRQRRWLLSATVVTSASGLLACGSDHTLGCMGFYAGSEADGGTGADAGMEGGAEGGVDATCPPFGGCGDAAAGDADAAPATDAGSDAVDASDADAARD